LTVLVEAREDQKKRMKRTAIQGGGVVDVVRWLSSDECHELDAAHMIVGLGQRLRSLGMPIDRLGLHFRTLHPHILGRSILWSPGQPVQIVDREAGAGPLPGSLKDLLDRVRHTREWVIEHSDSAEPLLEWFDVYKGHRLKGFVAAPLVMGRGPPGVAVFATRSSQKFTSATIKVLADIVPPLRCACEIRLLRRTESTLMDTYVGPVTGRRVLNGRIRRGEVETVQAALLLCDLRDFTVLSNQLPPQEILDRLNLYFDQVVPAIADKGGEVLKFMGDAVFAFFNTDTGPADSCAAAFDAARHALSQIDLIPLRDRPLLARVALHHGEVAYGNIGSEDRLDFTLIGRDVNLVSRIQTACATTGHALLMSPQFAGLLGRQGTRAIGRHLLKGFSEPVELFTSDLLRVEETHNSGRATTTMP
jgi:adenylate cyclase